MRIQGAVAKRKKTKLSVVIASLWASHGFFSARSMAPFSGARVERQNTAAPSMNRTWPPADAVTTSGEKRQPPAFRVLSTDASWTPSPSEAGPRSHTRGGTRTRNLLLRREAPYPLGHTSSCCSLSNACLMCSFSLCTTRVWPHLGFPFIMKYTSLDHDNVSERLRRWTRNPLGSARRGSNPLAVVSFACQAVIRKGLLRELNPGPLAP